MTKGFNEKGVLNDVQGNPEVPRNILIEKEFVFVLED